MKVDWVNNWPVFNNGQNITFHTSGRDEITQLITQSPPDNIRWRATLDSSTNTLELGWYQKNTPLKPCHSLTERPGYLRLHGGCYALSSPEAPALLLRKQESHDDEFCATLEFNPSRKGYEAGITVWWSMYSHASIGITAVLHDGQLTPTVVCRTPTGTAGVVDTSYPALTQDSNGSVFDASSPSRLSAQATPANYTLKLSQGASEWSFSFNVEDLCVMPPVGGAFTGTMFGIYAFGDWEPVLDPADFKDVMIRVLE